jgi:16S rRNA G966 N2-methylase RsmD
MKKELELNKKQWQMMSDEELMAYKKQVFEYYRETGFPYFSTDYLFRTKEFQKFIGFNDDNIIENDIVKQTMHGLSFLWSYFPHAFEVRCNNFLSPLEGFNNDEILKSVINKRIKFGDNISDNGIRKMLKIHSGVQSVSNFRPTSSSAIYKKYAQNKVVYDMSCGYGGRLLGAIKAGVKKYIGAEPCRKTYESLLKMVDDIKDFNKNNLFEINIPDIIIENKGSEVFVPEKNSVDFCFTSPPYFDTEKYSDEETQSYKKFPSKDEWMENFLGKTIDNCNICLKKDGIIAINIANVKSYKNLEEKFKELMKTKEFVLVETLKYYLSGIGGKQKYEPIFIFKRK